MIILFGLQMVLQMDMVGLMYVWYGNAVPVPVGFVLVVVGYCDKKKE